MKGPGWGKYRDDDPDLKKQAPSFKEVCMRCDPRVAGLRRRS
jgi:hypothetical protein